MRKLIVWRWHNWRSLHIHPPFFNYVAYLRQHKQTYINSKPNASHAKFFELVNITVSPVPTLIFQYILSSAHWGYNKKPTTK